MRKIIFLAIAGYVWNKFKAGKLTVPKQRQR